MGQSHGAIRCDPDIDPDPPLNMSNPHAIAPRMKTGGVNFRRLAPSALNDMGLRLLHLNMRRRPAPRGGIVKIVSIAVSKRKGTQKDLVDSALLIVNHGLEGDAHAGEWHRQVSFLASESIARSRDQGLEVDFGAFAENIATEGIEWLEVPVGTRLRLGDRAEVEITQIGKECHKKCAIFYKAGDCIMPKEGVFAKVLKDGAIKVGDPITFI